MKKEYEKIIVKLITKLGFEHEFVIKISLLAEIGISIPVLEELIKEYDSSLLE